MFDRSATIAKAVPIQGRGLEIAPLHNPVFRKSTHNIFYTDYTTTEELRKKAASNAHIEPKDIMELDFTWEPGRLLKDCVPPHLTFDYVIASHVIEHVPNPIGWIQQVMDALTVGGVFALIVPSKDVTFDAYRTPTSAADLIDAWIRDISIPSPRQIFDCLSYAVEDISMPPGQRSFETGIPFEKAPRMYSDHAAIGFACHSWSNNEYIDVHCSAFTPKSFVQTITQLIDIGLLNITLSEPVENWSEFYINFTKQGEPAMRKPPAPSNPLAASGPDLAHARKAFEDACVIQDKQAEQIRQLEGDVAHARAAFDEACVIQKKQAAYIQHLEGDVTHARGAFDEARGLQENQAAHIHRLEGDVSHARKAFDEASIIQQQLSQEAKRETGLLAKLAGKLRQHNQGNT